MKNCNIIKDLLPLYADQVCSEESRQAVTEHIAECAECRSELEKLGMNIKITADNDISNVKRIKRRIRFEKFIVTAVAAAITAGTVLTLLTWLINTDRSMDVERYGIRDNVYVSEHDGGLWLCIKGTASSYDFIYPTVSDSDGDHMGYKENFDADRKNGIGFTLKQRKISALSFADMESDTPVERKIADIDSLDENIRKVFYYDDVNKQEYILWERD